jgi:hypothetical protein
MTDTSVIILWTTRTGSAPVVQYSPDLSYSQAVTGTTRLTPLNTRMHRVELTDLQPNTRYHYKIYVDEVDLLPEQTLSFQTAPPSGSDTPFTFVAFGDYGNDTISQRRLRNQMLKDSFHFILTTGDNTWTLFLNTGNFKGPLAFVLPNFFSKPALTNPALEGEFLDTRPSEPIDAMGLETQEIPAVLVEHTDGVRYARIHPIMYPATGPRTSRLFSDLTLHSKRTLWDSVVAWFNGGAPASGQFLTSESFQTQVRSTSANGKFELESFEVFVLTYEGVPEEEEHAIDWDMLAQARVQDQVPVSTRLVRCATWY